MSPLSATICDICGFLLDGGRRGPVTAQLINLESNLCLGAAFDALDIKKNSTNQLKLLKAQ